MSEVLHKSQHHSIPGAPMSTTATSTTIAINEDMSLHHPRVMYHSLSLSTKDLT